MPAQQQQKEWKPKRKNKINSKHTQNICFSYWHNGMIFFLFHVYFNPSPYSVIPVLLGVVILWISFAWFIVKSKINIVHLFTLLHVPLVWRGRPSSHRIQKRTLTSRLLFVAEKNETHTHTHIRQYILRRDGTCLDFMVCACRLWILHMCVHHPFAVRQRTSQTDSHSRAVVADTSASTWMMHSSDVCGVFYFVHLNLAASVK